MNLFEYLDKDGNKEYINLDTVRRFYIMRHPPENYFIIRVYWTNGEVFDLKEVFQNSKEAEDFLFNKILHEKKVY